MDFPAAGVDDMLVAAGVKGVAEAVETAAVVVASFSSLLGGSLNPRRWGLATGGTCLREPACSHGERWLLPTVEECWLWWNIVGEEGDKNSPGLVLGLMGWWPDGEGSLDAGVPPWRPIDRIFSPFLPVLPSP